MPSITFFRQKRRDGGIRTGVDVGDDTVLIRFEGGSKDRDPTLLWYVDVRAEGAGLPTSPEEARRWFGEHAAELRDGLEAMACLLPAGVDPSEGPVRHEVLLPGTGRRKIKASIYVAFLRRAEATRMPAILRDVAEHWDLYVGTLVGES